jgi:N12 class adenine-specific DNA methylase
VGRGTPRGPPCPRRRRARALRRDGRNFLAPVETVEHGADGTLKVVTRLGEYKNFPDLARMFRSFADVRTTSSLGFQLPELVGGKATVHVADPPRNRKRSPRGARNAPNTATSTPANDTPDPVIAILGTARATALHPATISTGADRGEDPGC